MPRDPEDPLRRPAVNAQKLGEGQAGDSRISGTQFVVAGAAFHLLSTGCIRRLVVEFDRRGDGT